MKKMSEPINDCFVETLESLGNGIKEKISIDFRKEIAQLSD